MKKKIVTVACGLSLLLAFGACKKKEEAPPVVPQFGSGQQQPQGLQQGLPPGHQPTISVGETSVVLPESVKGNWKAVVITVENKTTNKKEEFTVDLNSELAIPNSNLKVSVGDFLPDFKMDGRTITSLSNDLNNPAVRIKVFENENEVFKGWLYSKFPSIHPFEHPTYGILLKNGVKKG
jgi:hypothetical protein